MYIKQDTGTYSQLFLQQLLWFQTLLQLLIRKPRGLLSPSSPQCPQLFGYTITPSCLLADT